MVQSGVYLLAVPLSVCPSLSVAPAVRSWQVGTYLAAAVADEHRLNSSAGESTQERSTELCMDCVWTVESVAHGLYGPHGMVTP